MNVTLACAVCEALMQGHPRCEACGIFVGQGHEATGLQEARYAPISSAAVSAHGITRDEARRMQLCPSCIQAAVQWRKKQNRGGPSRGPG